ncbi:putative FBD-associated F-box protein At1g61330 [Primulina tabacum]|uniref:putative FBD-associated F-box protein At1g61330 n=1 Tax=Primulina tabacum TaxID=48773 RepID=UPI003F5AAFD2
MTSEFINCDILYNLKNYARDLKWFTVLVVKNCKGILTIRIKAPSLHTLHYHGKICEFRFESRLPYLSDVVFEITSPRAFQLLPRRKDVMIDLSRVTRLAVNHTILEALCARSEESGYMEFEFDLWKLKELHLLVGGESHVNPLDIALFLKKCPRVERLFIDLRKYAFAESLFWENYGRKNFAEFAQHFHCSDLSK